MQQHKLYIITDSELEELQMIFDMFIEQVQVKYHIDYVHISDFKNCIKTARERFLNLEDVIDNEEIEDLMKLIPSKRNWVKKV